jgi:hypothetical protein
MLTYGAGHFYVSQSDKGGLVFGGAIDGYNTYGQRGALPMVEEVTAAAVTPNILTEGRREKEEETIWRGNQYVRGIRFFFMKNRRLPTSLEELTQSQPTGRFMRKAYKDPLDKADGSWRLIYLGPSGQLIGSNKLRALIPVGPLAGITAPATSPMAGPAATPPAGASPATSITEPQGASPNPVTTVGGSLIGIGSKTDERSIKWYLGAKNYLEYEFVWDPTRGGYPLNPQQQVTAPGEKQPVPPTADSQQTPPPAQTNPPPPEN